jgi:HD-GYP domain-containing protein (c-di-GMP phosphodiesterase class II)
MRRNGLINIYIGGLAIAATASLAYALSAERWSAIDPAMFALLLVLAAATQRVPVFLFRSSAVSVSFAATIAAFVLYGTGAALVTNLVCAAVNAFTPRKSAQKVVFNIASLTVSAFFAAETYTLAGGMHPPADVLRTVLAVAASGFVYYGTSSTLTALVIALSSKTPFTAVWRENYAWMLVNYVATSVNGASLAIAYVGLGFFGAAAFVLPLGVAWYSFKLYMARSEETRRHNEELVALNARLREANNSLERSQVSVVEALVQTLEAKDETVGRAASMVGRAVALARKLGLPEEDVDAVRLGALIHDVGRIAIPEQILRKAGPLSTPEWELVKQHPAIGAQLIANVPSLEPARPIVLAHHERYDGSGYPRRLRGAEIPITAQIIAVVDAYTAMTEARAYRAPYTEEQSLDELRRNSGKQFNPAVVQAFIAVLAVEPRGARPPESTPAFQLRSVTESRAKS